MLSLPNVILIRTVTSLIAGGTLASESVGVCLKRSLNLLARLSKADVSSVLIDRVCVILGHALVRNARHPTVQMRRLTVALNSDLLCEVDVLSVSRPS